MFSILNCRYFVMCFSIIQMLFVNLLVNQMKVKEGRYECNIKII